MNSSLIVKNYPIIDNNQLKPEIADLFYFYISNGNFYLKSENVYLVTSLALYLNKGVMVLADRLNNNVKYILVKKILQKQAARPKKQSKTKKRK